MKFKILITTTYKVTTLHRNKSPTLSKNMNQSIFFALPKTFLYLWHHFLPSCLRDFSRPLSILWISLPQSVWLFLTLFNFRHSLKTNLFRKAYNNLHIYFLDQLIPTQFLPFSITCPSLCKLSYAQTVQYLCCLSLYCKRLCKHMLALCESCIKIIICNNNNNNSTNNNNYYYYYYVIILI